MRNLQCTITDMRKKVFAEVAKLAYEGGDYYTRLEKLPYELMPGEVGTVRESISWSGPLWASGSAWPWAFPCEMCPSIRCCLTVWRKAPLPRNTTIPR